MSALRKLIPLGDRILVKRVEVAAKTASGVFLPDVSGQRSNEAQVVAVGPGLKNKDGTTIPLQCKIGDTVLLPEYGGSLIKINDKDFHLFRDDDVLGKFE